MFLSYMAVVNGVDNGILLELMDVCVVAVTLLTSYVT